MNIDRLKEIVSSYTGDAILIAIVVVAMKFGPRVWSGFSFIQSVKKEHADSLAQRLAARQQERDDARKALEEVERDLRQTKRELERREDFSRQDRAHIRFLKVRIKTLHGDYDDIDEQIQHFFEVEDSRNVQ